MKKISENLNNFLEDYRYIIVILILLIFYAAYDVVSAYLAPNTKTLRPRYFKGRCINDNLPFCNISDDIQFTKFFLMALDGVSFHFM